MKKRILALLLAFSMMLSLLPVSALADTGGGIGSAAYASNEPLPDLVMDNDTGRPKLSGIPQDPEGVYQGDGWRYVPQDSARNDKDTLYLDGASFNLSGASIWCNVVVSPRTTVENASFNYRDNPSGFPSVTNNGILQSCMFIECNITNNSTIQKSTIEDCIITNNATIRDSLFSINSSATLPFKFEKSGSITDSVFDFNPTTYGLTLNVHSLQASPIKALDISTASNLITYLYLRSNVFYTIGYPKIKVYCYNPDNPTDGSYNVRYINGVPAKSYDPDFKYADHCYIFTVQDNDVVLSSSEPTMPTLEMDYNGWPKTDGITPNNGVYYGDGWKYENSTLTLESGNYDFSYTYPKNSTGTRHSNHVKCNVVVNKGAAITGGILDGDSLTNSGTVKDILFAGYWLTNNNGTLSCLLGSSVYDDPSFTRHTMTAVDGSQIYYTVNQQSTGNGKQLYFTGTPKFTVKLEKSDIRCINGDKNYGGLRPSVVHGYYTFTPEQEEDIVLNREPYVTDLVITEGGIPDTTGRQPIYDTDGTPIGCRGNGWTFDGETLTLESGSYDFSKNGLGQLAPDVKLVVGPNATLTGGVFNEKPDGLTTDNVQTIILNGSDSIVAVNGLSSAKWNTTLYAIKDSQVEIKADTDITNINGWDIGKFPGGSSYPNGEDDKTTVSFRMPDGPVVLNDTIIHEPFTMTNGYPTASNGGKTACKGEGWEYILGDPEHGDFLFLSNAQIDFSKISDGSPVECKLFIGHGVAVQGGTFNGKVINNGGGILGGTFNGDVINNGGILGGTFNGAVENHGTIENGVFNGAVTNIDPGTVSNSITGTGTLNGKPITPNAYTLTVTGGGLVNGKTSAVVKADEEVRLTVGEGQDGMSFNYWDLPTPLLKALTDSSSGGFSNKVESLTFTMPDLSEYTEDKSFTIRLDIRPAELPDDDDGPSVLGTMATVAVGGAAAGILVWQGVSLGVDSYLQLSLPGGVPVPTNRRELVKLLWETAGKPDVVLPALYGDVSAEDGELQKATRWAIDNGLVKPADETDASRFDPDRSVSKYEVARAWFKVQQMLK